MCFSFYATLVFVAGFDLGAGAYLKYLTEARRNSPNLPENVGPGRCVAEEAVLNSLEAESFSNPDRS
jgi:hypothetical protein